MEGETSPMGTPVEFEVEDGWCHVRLTEPGPDGSAVVISIKPVVIDVYRLDELDAEGRPQYAIRASIAARIDSKGGAEKP